MHPVDKAWSLVKTGGQAVDAEALFTAIRDPAVLGTDDPRTRVLVRDAVLGLRHYWGGAAFDGRLRHLPQRDAIRSFLTVPSEEIGFPSLRTRIVDVTDPAVLGTMCRELGQRLREPATIVVGGSMALMAAFLLSRRTEDIDVVDELPPAIRREHTLLAELADRYELKLTHFQSHYLPDGWQNRTESFGVFGQLTVRLIDPIDALTGKLFSRRTKDLDDIRGAWDQIDQDIFRQRIARSTTAFRTLPEAVAAAEHNWYVLTGEERLPAAG